MSDRSFVHALTIGTLGGVALILTVTLSTRGVLIFLPYALLVAASGADLRAQGIQPFSRRIALVLSAFALATVIAYIYIGLRLSHTLFTIPVSGHAWRLALLLAIGCIVSAAVASIPVRRQAA